MDYYFTYPERALEKNKTDIYKSFPYRGTNRSIEVSFFGLLGDMLLKQAKGTIHVDVVWIEAQNSNNLISWIILIQDVLPTNINIIFYHLSIEEKIKRFVRHRIYKDYFETDKESVNEYKRYSIKYLDYVYKKYSSLMDTSLNIDKKEYSTLFKRSRRHNQIVNLLANLPLQNARKQRPLEEIWIGICVLYIFVNLSSCCLKEIEWLSLYKDKFISQDICSELNFIRQKILKNET